MKITQFLVFALFPIFAFCERVTIIGSNYVGLTTAAVLLQCGHEVTCVDINTEKIAQLNQGKMTIHEPGLDKILFDASSSCTFTDDIRKSLDSPIIYVCVGTPVSESGECDCKDIYSVLQDIAAFSTESKIVCIKSTIPPGTIRKLQTSFSNCPHQLLFVYNPEFMRQGSAIDDIKTKNPIVLGGESDELLSRIESLYRDFIKTGTAVIKTNFETAELIKYSWNAFSAIRIAYVNELSLLCNQFSGDIFKLIEAIAFSETLLPTADLKPGPGYGGSCLPKDTKAFAALIEDKGIYSSMVHQAIRSNEQHIQSLIDCIYQSLHFNIENKKIAVLGLAFKANTDDIRHSPSIRIISSLLNDGAHIQAYDPSAARQTEKIFPHITYVDSSYDAVKDVDCILVLTDWDDIKDIDLKKVSMLCKQKIIFDTRNLFNPATLNELGFITFNLGRL